MKLLKTGVDLRALIFSIALVACSASGAEPTRGVVIGVHPASSTAGIAKMIGLADAKQRNGRFAVIEMRNGVDSAAKYALVYVPADIVIGNDDIVSLAPTSENVVANPGTGIVAAVVGKGKIARADQ